MNDKYRQIAQIHSDSITTGFLSALGMPFLATLYRAIDRCPYSFISIEKQGDDVVGFVAGTISVNEMYRWIIVRYGLLFFFQLSPLVFRPSFLKRILETLFYAAKKKGQKKEEKKPDVASVSAELLSIAVSDRVRGKGVGSALLKQFEGYLRKRAVSKYKVVTYSEDKISNAFYTQNEHSLARQFVHHDNVMNEYMKEFPSQKSRK